MVAAPSSSQGSRALVIGRHPMTPWVKPYRGRLAAGCAYGYCREIVHDGGPNKCIWDAIASMMTL